MYDKRHIKFFCCTHLNVATRIIAFIGMVTSAVIGILLIRDKYANNFRNMERVSQFLGYEWDFGHFHKYRWIMMVSHTILHLLSSLILLIGTYVDNSWCAVPWLVCKIFGVVVKISALGYDLAFHAQNSRSFYILSIIYIVLIIWWWTVVVASQLMPNKILKLNQSNMETKNFKSPSPESVFDSPVAYRPNVQYTVI